MTYFFYVIDLPTIILNRIVLLSKLKLYDMKKLKSIAALFMLFIASLAFIRCESNEEINKEKELTPTLVGEMHNEAVFSYLNVMNNKFRSRNTNTITVREVLTSVKEDMIQKYPEMNLESFDINEVGVFLDLDTKVSDFKKRETFENMYSKMKEVALKKGVNQKAIDYIDNIYHGRSKGVDQKYTGPIGNNNFNIDNFDVVYEYSKNLWTKEAPKGYLITNSNLARGCDPTSQLIFADAAGTAFGGLLTLGFGAPLFGGAVSGLVRSGQLDNNGGCLE